MTPLSILLVDDESLARESLSMQLTSRPNLKIIGSCNNAQEALTVIQFSQPDVIFLDIELPGMSGIELARQLNAQNNQARLIFVTAFGEFALEAFECNALDYLLKPFSDERLDACLDIIMQDLKVVHTLAKLQKLDDLLQQKTGSSIDGFIHSLEVSTHNPLSELQQIISLKCGSQWVRVKLDRILWIEAAGDYMCVHTEDGNHIIRKTLKQLEQELNNRHFPRVSRSAMLNSTKLSRLTPNSNGEYLAELCNGENIKVGRKYRFHLDEFCAELQQSI